LQPDWAAASIARVGLPRLGLPHPLPRVVHGLALVAGLAIFFVDLQIPLGSAIGMLYVAVILLGLWTPWPAFPWVAAAGATTAIVADLAWAGVTDVPIGVLVNRPLMAMVFVLTAVLVSRAVRFQREALAHVEVLADFKRALDAAAIVAITDVTGRITYVNDTFCQISGYSRDELIGQDHRIINSTYHPPEFIRNLWQTIARGRVWHGELRNRAKQGHLYWVDTTIVPFLDEHGKPYQYIAIRSDITARKEAEQKLTRQAALARVGQMAAVLAHEIRNPLAGIRGAIEVMHSRRPDGDPERPVMADIVRRIESLATLLDDLMVFARPRRPAFREVPLLRVVRDAAQLARRDPAAAGVAIDVQGDEGVALVDPDLVRRTLFNLLLNAAQAMGGQGAVDVSVRHESDGITIVVRDTGPGIPADVREHVFEPFFTTKVRGGGLGLSIARSTAELHGGTLVATCPVEGGTVMTLTLPRTPATAAPAADARP